ncbi:hypothetical protein MMC18_002211 [Xylographa bjoerkii]|nr:hypothetical protein [Xylographa bjoerkii]
MATGNPLLRAAEIQARLGALKTRQQPANSKVFLQSRPMAHKNYTAKAASTHIDAGEFSTFASWPNEPVHGATIVLGLFHTPPEPNGPNTEYETWGGALVKIGKKGKRLYLWDCNIEGTSGLPNFQIQCATKGHSELSAYLGGKFDLREIWIGGKTMGDGDTPFELTMQWLDDVLASGDNSALGAPSFACVWEKK